MFKPRSPQDSCLTKRRQPFVFDNQHVPIGTTTTLSNWVYHDVFGVAHPFNGFTRSVDGCTGTNVSLNTLSTDGSGYTLQATAGGWPVTILSSGGQVIHPPNGSSSGPSPSGASTFTDRNGNQISDNGSGIFTDTLGTTA